MMSNFLGLLKTKQHFKCFGPITNDEIIQAEERLGISFAQEYRDYVKNCGFASILGHEFTGICKTKRLNVVDVTESERSKNPQLLNTMYVVEQTNMDDIVIWQDTGGAIYQSSKESPPDRICASLEEYLQMI